MVPNRSCKPWHQMKSKSRTSLCSRLKTIPPTLCTRRNTISVVNMFWRKTRYKIKKTSLFSNLITLIYSSCSSSISKSTSTLDKSTTLSRKSWLTFLVSSRSRTFTTSSTWPLLAFNHPLINCLRILLKLHKKVCLNNSLNIARTKRWIKSINCLK